MYLEETPKGGIDIVSLADCCVEDLDGMLASFDIDDLGAE